MIFAHELPLFTEQSILRPYQKFYTRRDIIRAHVELFPVLLMIFRYLRLHLPERKALHTCRNTFLPKLLTSNAGHKIDLVLGKS